MDNFIVSARKYRPATFQTVVGQDHITTTLKNAIKNHHLAQAFLFCGPRGVGKTTCARILAKTINCFQIAENTEACNQCESCTSFNTGQSLNVYELDAASNNSVDDIRHLIDQVRFAPQLGKYKIYIIDEVHMLSQQAFNAFLKTLEEPPAHAIFILATTEKHKIIPTILSRCQIFDFNRIQIEDIAGHLAYIAKQEEIAAERDALHIIAQKADGALRDALSMFDQLVNFTGNNLTYKAVIENLNILDYDYYFKLTDLIIEENISGSLLLLNEILKHGFDLHHFIVGLGDHFRNLLVAKDVATLELLEVGNNIKEKYKSQSQICSLPFLIAGLDFCNKTDFQYKASKNPRLLVELTLMQLCCINNSKTSENSENKSSNPVKQTNFTNAQLKTQYSKPIQEENTIVATASSLQPLPSVTPAKFESTVQKTGSTPKNDFSKKLVSPSISQFVNNAKNNLETKTSAVSSQASYNEEQAAETFTFEELLAAWNKYTWQLNQQGKVNLYTTLTTHKPLLKENFLVELTIENKVQEEEISREKPDIVGFLRKELKNYQLQLTTVYNMNTSESDKKYYTNAEKYKRLAEINPNINKLRQQLDLDI